MKFFLSVFFISFVFVSAAQTVTAIDIVQTKPGEFDNYIEFLKKNWVVAREKAKEKGFIISFQFIDKRQDSARDISGDIVLMTEYKDEATYKEREKIFQQIFKENFPNGPVLVNGKRSKDLADIKSSNTLKKE